MGHDVTGAVSKGVKVGANASGRSAGKAWIGGDDLVDTANVGLDGSAKAASLRNKVQVRGMEGGGKQASNQASKKVKLNDDGDNFLHCCCKA